MGKHLAVKQPTLLQADAEKHAGKCPLPTCRYGYRNAETALPKHREPKTLRDIVWGINPSKEN